jgi:glycosyltransferase involved in cell wall biosynthesis
MIDFYDKNYNLGDSLSYEADKPLVAILLCTYNGANFLVEQIDSLAAQTYQNWIVIASDDGSTDQTREILQQYQVKWPTGKLIIRNGPQKGFCQNFLSLACDPEIKADYYAFCDQDDVWLPEKLNEALKVLGNKKNHTISLYCSRTTYINEVGDEIGSSPKFIYPKTFRNALVQCVAGGNTMVFNLAGKLLLEEVGPVAVPSHDWWLYQLITGNGGVVNFDQTPSVKYRQHPKSLVGENTSLVSKLDRLMMVLNGKFGLMISENINALESINHLLTPENLEMLQLFKKMRSGNIKDRFRIIEVCRIFRQSWPGTLCLMIAAVFKRI